MTTRSLPALLAGVLLVLPTAPASASTADPVLALSLLRDGDSEIALRGPDGRLTALTRDRASDHAPAWSADGRWLAFVSDRDGDEEVFVVRADGTGLRQLTRNRARDTTPAWSPDGRWLAFTSDRDGGEPEVYRMRTDGTAQVRLTRTAPHVADLTPAWSPGGHYLVFTSNREGFEDFEVVRMRMNGTEVRTLTRTAPGIGDTAPDWSPDGRSIAFTSERGGTGQGVYVMRADGTGVRAVVDTAGVDEVFPRWVRDGSWLVHTTFPRDGVGGRAALVRADGTGHRWLTATTQDVVSADPRPR